MSPDLHPEELLDKASAGTLSSDERARLNQHLHACAACRFEQQAKVAFANAPSAQLNVDNLVARALAGMPSQQPRASVRRRVPAAWAAAAVLATAVSFA